MWLRLALLRSFGTSRWMKLDKHIAYPLIYHLCVPDLICWYAIIWCIIKCTVNDFLDQVIFLCILQHDLGCKGIIEAFWQWELPTFLFRGRFGISCFAFCGSPSLLILLPSGIPGCFPFLPLLVVMERRHIHSALESKFRPCGRDSWTKQTYFLLGRTCPLQCVSSAI